MRKYVGLLCAAALTVPAALMITASPAAAAPVTSCGVAKGTATFNPPLPKLGSTTKVKTQLKSKGTVSGCTGGGVKSGTTTFTGIRSKTGSNCSTLVAPKASDAPTKGTIVIKWNTGKSSTASGFSIKQTDATHATTTGKITTGLFKGKVIKGIVEFKPETGGCTTKALAKVTYVNKNAQHKVVKFTVG